MAPELIEATHENTTLELGMGPVTSAGPALQDAEHAIAAQEMLSFAARYDAQHLLGRGGMGEVRLHRDARIGRDVAMKVIRADQPDQAATRRTRFLREARVQGQLEHPSIVPVYDVGFGKDGALYFTMKRVQGLTFADIFDKLRKKDPQAAVEHTQRKLLAAFASVCLAVAFAHTRRVIHRDLKPSNIMVGRFGEVYVLDWGIAKILDEVDEPSNTAVDAEPLALDDDSQQINVTTKAGAFVGTLGYVSPEQLHGDPIDARSDVYSLGAILFGLLALEPLNAGSSLDVVRRTTEGVDARCSVRAPKRDIPPELEAICVKATRVEPQDRFQSARDLYDAVQRYLDGDRDTERRKELAQQHAKVAMTAVERARVDLTSASTHRANALAELGRSLALDPTNEQALAGIVSLLVDPPREMPPEVAVQMEASRTKAVRTIATTGGITYAFCLLIFIGFWSLMGVKDWRTTTLVGVLCMTAVLVCAVQRRVASQALSYGIIALTTLNFMTLTRLTGPLVILPSFTMAVAMVYALYPVRAVQRTALIAMCAVPLGALFLEWNHFIPASYVFRNDAMVVVPQMVALPAGPTLGLATAITTFLLLAAVTIVRRVGNALAAAEQKLAIQSWQFRQLVPERARPRVTLRPDANP